MTYPRVLTEQETINDALAGMSLARFGDGEFNIATGGSAVSQDHDPRLAAELRAILQYEFGARVTPCIPRLGPSNPRSAYFEKYVPHVGKMLTNGPYVPHVGKMLTNGPYGSSFVSRPECAPHIDCPYYWASVRKLWAGKTVAYVGGQDTLLRQVRKDAQRVFTISAPTRNAYADVLRIETECLHTRYDIIVISLGAAGTVLAARLARGGQHAVDLGHVGQFMENPGAYAIQPEELASPEYRAMLKHQHAVTYWGKGGHSWADKVKAFHDDLGATSVLDYGCGRGTLKQALTPLGVKCFEYDPGILGKDMPPKQADIVASTDVFEHIEPEKVDAVLRHTFLLARKGGFFAIAKQPAKAILSDGRNAHLVCQPTDWWVKRLLAAGWPETYVAEDAWKKCLVLCRK